jgi:hypothetical protein
MKAKGWGTGICTAIGLFISGRNPPWQAIEDQRATVTALISV